MRAFFRSSLGGAAAALLCAPAQADPFWLYERAAAAPRSPGHFYAGSLVAGDRQHLPDFKSTVSFFTATQGAFLRATTFETEANGVLPGGVIGYLFRDGAFPAWLGARVRIEVYGQAIALSGKAESSRVVGATEGLTVAGIGGTTLYSLATGCACTFTEELRLRREGYALGLRLAADRPLGLDLVMTPAISVFGGQTFDSYELRYSFTLDTLSAPGQVNERIQTNEIGIAIGTALTWQFAPGWALRAAGSAGGVWLDSRLTGVDCFNGVAAVPPGTPCGPSNPAFEGSSVSAARTTLGFRGTAALGLSADLRFAIATIGGHFRYDSRIPGADNPRFVSQTFTGSPVAGGNPPARLRFSGGTAYGGFLRVVVPLH